MKTKILIILLLSSLFSFGQIPLMGDIIPANAADEYPMVNSDYVKGGLKQVEHYTDLFNIPIPRLTIGMLASVSDSNNRLYQLTTISPIMVWNELVMGGTPNSFSNGLSEVSNVVKLGGDLTEQTIIYSNDYDFVIVGGNIAHPYAGGGEMNPVINLNSSSINTYLTDANSIENGVYIDPDGIHIGHSYGGYKGINVQGRYPSPTLLEFSGAGNAFPGATYQSDYSANYTDRSLIDKGYADATYGGGGGSSYVFMDGLTEVNDTVKLGGEINQNVILSLANKLFVIQSNLIASKSLNFYINPNATLGPEIGLTYNDVDYGTPHLSSILAREYEVEIKVSSDDKDYVGINILNTDSDSASIICYADNKIIYFPGIQYDIDYSANYTDRSLIDKGYADSHYGGSGGGNPILANVTVEDTTRWGIDTDTHLTDAEIGTMGYIKTYTETDPAFVAWGYDYNSLVNTPTIVTPNPVVQSVTVEDTTRWGSGGGSGMDKWKLSVNDNTNVTDITDEFQIDYKGGTDIDVTIGTPLFGGKQLSFQIKQNSVATDRLVGLSGHGSDNQPIMSDGAGGFKYGVAAQGNVISSGSLDVVGDGTKVEWVIPNTMNKIVIAMLSIDGLTNIILGKALDGSGDAWVRQSTASSEAKLIFKVAPTGSDNLTLDYIYYDK